METKKKIAKCLVPECQNPGNRRGLCPSCRIAAKRAIQTGETTEAELIRQNLMTAKGKKTKLAHALAERRKKEEVQSVASSAKGEGEGQQSSAT